MTDEQVRDVRDLTRKAGIKPTTTKIDAEHPLLRELAPGERVFVDSPTPVAPVTNPAPRWGSGARAGGGRGRGGQGSGAARGGQGGSRSGQGTGGRGGAARSGNGGGSGRSGAPKRGNGTGGSGRSGGAPKRAGGGSTVAYSSSSTGSAAAFSAGTRVGRR